MGFWGSSAGKESACNARGPGLIHGLGSSPENGQATHASGFPGDSDGTESACNVEDLGSIPGMGRSPGEGKGYPLRYSFLQNPHGQSSLAGYSPWGHKELDTTKGLSIAQHIYIHTHKHTYVPQLHYPFIYQWTFRLCPCLWSATFKNYWQTFKIGNLT